MQRRFFATAAAAVLAAGMALAQTPGPQAQRRSGAPLAGQMGMPQRMIRNLNLTDAQRQQAQSIFQQARQSAQSIREQLRQNREALDEAIKTNNAGQINQLSLTMGNLQGQALAIQSNATAQFYNILTPDQKTRFDQMRQRTRNMMQRQRQRVMGQPNAQ